MRWTGTQGTRVRRALRGDDERLRVVVRATGIRTEFQVMFALALETTAYLLDSAKAIGRGRIWGGDAPGQRSRGGLYSICGISPRRGEALPRIRSRAIDASRLRACCSRTNGTG